MARANPPSGGRNEPHIGETAVLDRAALSRGPRGLGFKLLLMSIDNVRTLVEQAPTFLPQMPDLASRRSKCCEIPERECPPRCVCEVTWDASPGEAGSKSPCMTNASHSGRTFQLRSGPHLPVPVGRPGTISLSPSSLSLAARTLRHRRRDVHRAAGPRRRLPRGHRRVRRCEQCVCIRLRVRCKKTCGDECCTCEVVQGDPPVRIRAHHWYDRFQCTEPCVVPQREPHDHDR